MVTIKLLVISCQFFSWRAQAPPVVKITFVDKDAPLAQKIKETLNGGTMVHYKNSNYLDLLFPLPRAKSAGRERFKFSISFIIAN
jgi:hypothetical protein